MTVPDEDRGFGRGLLTGVIAFVVAVQCLVAYWFSAFEAMYRDMGSGAHISHVTIFVIRLPWLVGVPVVELAAIAYLIVKRPRALWIYGATLALVIAALGFTVYFGYRPIWQLAGNIRAD